MKGTLLIAVCLVCMAGCGPKEDVASLKLYQSYNNGYQSGVEAGKRAKEMDKSRWSEGFDAGWKDGYYGKQPND